MGWIHRNFVTGKEFVKNKVSDYNIMFVGDLYLIYSDIPND